MCILKHRFVRIYITKFAICKYPKQKNATAKIGCVSKKQRKGRESAVAIAVMQGEGELNTSRFYFIAYIYSALTQNTSKEGNKWFPTD